MKKGHPVSVRVFADPISMLDFKFSEGKCVVGQGLHFITNGWVISAQAGSGNYWSGRPGFGDVDITESLTNQTIRPDCEIALWPIKTKEMIEISSDLVEGYVPWGAVIDLVYWLSRQAESPSVEEMQKMVRQLLAEHKEEWVEYREGSP